MDFHKIKKELKYRTARSSGSGGQHVNKVETKVELILPIDQSEGLSDKERKLIHKRLKSKINKNEELIVVDQSSRSQISNRKSALRKLKKMLTKALRPVPKRKGATQFKADQKKRLKAKKIRSEKKRLRGKVKIE